MRVDPYLRAFVLRGKNRKTLLQALSKRKEATQAELHHTTKLYRTHVRRSLLELEYKGLVKCLNPKDRIYKLYTLTELGLEVLKQV
jgi:DNA-binding MarR family transcriptional regulator